jgi:uroporphyrinogen decarboxylase
MLKNLPVTHPCPDSKKFIGVLMGREKTARPPLVEYLVDAAVMKPIVTGLLGRNWADYGIDRETQKKYLDNFIEFWLRMGYDFVRFEQGLGFAERQVWAHDETSILGQQRAWADEHQGSIQSWADFERYPWPKIETMDFFPFDYISRSMPEGMGLMTCHAGGIFEHLSWIMSYEGLCLALHEDAELVRAVAYKIGSLMTGFYQHLLDLDHGIAIFAGDDMGFKTGLLISPADLRKNILPWHRRFAAMAHEKGLPYFLHSCGNLETIMEDLVEEVKIDGKHSFEDAIIPIRDFQERYGNRIAVLGGLDVNILSASSPQEIRKHTRRLIEACGSRGRFAVGSGNSIPSYVPVENYLAMVDEALNGQEF